MKNLVKLLSIVLAAIMVIGVLAACQKKDPKANDPDLANARPLIEAKDNSAAADSSALKLTVDLSAYDKLQHEADDEDWKVYSEALGDYYKYLLAADAEKDVSGKYVILAMAEAKLLESGVFVPTSTNGGRKAISRAVPHTVSNALWGNDSYRYYSILVATEPLKTVDRDELKKMFVEYQGNGTYMIKAKKYLADKGYTLKDNYTIGYTSDPQTWDILGTYRAADSEAIVNTFDGLYEYDNEGRMVPALATSYEVSADGLTYTFKIREGAKWYTRDGEEYAEVTAEDWVTGMKHLFDSKGGTEYLVDGIIKNAREYLNGDITDFSQVGVKAVDKYTLQYTLEKPTSYFITMFGYNPFAPLNKAYFESQGGETVDENNPSLYGTDPDHILYCGPYLVTENTAKNKIEFTLNENYYNKEFVNVKKITWLYNDGKDVTKAYNDMKQGTIDGAGLNTTTEPMAKNDGFEANIYISSTDATTFAGFLNLNRKNYETIQKYGMVSTKTDAQKADSIAALQNVHFRNALLFSIDRAQYNSIMVGDEVKFNSLRNTYTPGTFVKLTKDVTVDLNGKSTTFKKDTYYGEIVQAVLTSDGSPLKVWNPTGGNGDGSSDGFDGWYNKDEAVKELNKAIEELAAKGITISESNPIYIDYPYYSANENYAARTAALKKNIEEVLDGKVIINPVATEDVYGWYYAGYWCDTGADVNYDLYDVSGWGPDYGDPRTYLNTMKPDHNGDMTHVLGLY